MKGIPDNFSSGNVATRAIYPSSRLNWYIGLLLISKCLRVFCLYLSNDLLKLLHVVQFLFVTKTITAVLLVLIQKPFTLGERIKKEQWPKLVRHAFAHTALNLLWLFGLTLCGPLRTILLFEHSDIVVIAGIGALFSSNSSPSKLRGAVFFLLGITALLLFDNDNVQTLSADHPEGQQHHGFSHLFYYVISWAGVSDHKGGVLLLVITMCLQTGYNASARKLAIDIGGGKRLNALITFISALLLAPWAFFLRIIQEGTIQSWFTLFVLMCVISVFVFVLDYYVVSISTQKLDVGRSAQCATVGVFVSAFLFALIWNHPYVTAVSMTSKAQDVIADEHLLSGGVVFSCVMFLFAVSLLSSPQKMGSKGYLVGYSSSGLPLYTFPGEALHKTSQSILLIVGKSLKQILDEPDSRKIFYFLCLNLAFTFVELIYGIWTNSLGLISDGFHMLFDCSALVMGLYAALVTRWKATRTFSFGYGRVEVLSGFMNGLFLVVIAFFVFMEGLSRLYDPPEIITERLLTVSVAGLLVNLVGIFAFHHGHSHASAEVGCSPHQHKHQSHQHSHLPAHQGHMHVHSNANMQGVFLHILADTLGSVGVIVSSLLIENFGWLIADPLCSLFIAALIFLSVLPLLKDSSLILLLRTPPGKEKEIASALQKVLALEGVISYRDQHFWQHCTGLIAGSLHVQIQNDASEQQIINQTMSIFREIGISNFTIQVEKEEYFHHLSGLSSQVGAMVHTTINMNQLNFNDAALIIKAV